MKFIEKLPYGLRKVFAEVANIPTAVGYLPAVPFASATNEKNILLTESLIATTALTAGIIFVPALTLAVATPLYILGRGMQGLQQYNPPPAHKFFKLEK